MFQISPIWFLGNSTLDPHLNWALINSKYIATPCSYILHDNGLCMNLELELKALIWTWMNVFMDDNVDVNEMNVHAWFNTWINLIHVE